MRYTSCKCGEKVSLSITGTVIERETGPDIDTLDTAKKKCFIICESPESVIWQQQAS